MVNVLKVENLHAFTDQLKTVYFQYYYPIKTDKYTSKEANIYEYIQGLKTIRQKEFIKDDTKNYQRIDYCDEHYYSYINYLRNIIKDVDKPIVLCAIPSSKEGKVNIVNELVLDICKDRTNKFINGLSLFTKIQDEDSAHDEHGKRSYKNHMNTWKIGNKDLLNECINKNLPILVIDDVVTTGSSFEAAYYYLTQNNISPENLTFFAYGKTISNKLVHNIKPNPNIDLHKNNDMYDTVIFDIDQTIAETINPEICRYKDYERYSHIGKNNIFFNGIEELFNTILQKNINILFVTNNTRDLERAEYSYIKLILCHLLKKHLIDSNNDYLYSINNKFRNQSSCKDYINTNLYLDNKNHQLVGKIYLSSNGYLNCDFSKILLLPENMSSYKDDKKTRKYLKPSNKPILDILKNVSHSKVLGIGNSETDIMAYQDANIDAGLAKWGNESEANAAIIAQTKPDYKFEKPSDLLNFLRGNNIEQ